MHGRFSRHLLAVGLFAAAALVASGLQDAVSSGSFVANLADSAATPFSTNVRVTDNTTGFPQHVEPTLVVDSHGVLTAGWKEALTPDGRGQRVALSRSEDGGRTWSPNVLKATTAPGLLQSDPWLTLDEAGGLHYASLEYSSDGGVGGVTVTNSADGGRTWSAPVQVDDRPGFADKEAMTSDGNGSLYIVYDDVLGNNFDQSDDVDLVITRSTDRGATWSPTVSVVGTPGNILGPVVAARPDGRVTVVAWNLTEGNVLAFTSTDHGATWGPAVRVNAFPGSATWVNNTWMTSMPSLVEDDRGRLHVAWADYGGGNRDILAALSVNGTDWFTPAPLNDVTTGDQWMPSLSMDARGTLHAAWLDGRTGAWNVYYANSSVPGFLWSANVRVTTAETPLSFVRPGDYLALAGDANGTAYVAWTDGRSGSLAIEFARSTPFSIPNAPQPFPWAVVVAVAGGLAVLAAAVILIELRRRRGSPPAP